MSNVRIDIRAIRVRAIVGVNPGERRKKQEVRVHVSFIYDASRAVKTDNLKYAVDYRQMTHEIVEKVRTSRFYLIERLSRFVLDLVKSYPGVNRAKVVVEKPHALSQADTVSCRAEYRWARP